MNARQRAHTHTLTPLHTPLHTQLTFSEFPQPVKAAVAAPPPFLLPAQEVKGERVLSSHAEEESSDEAGGRHPTPSASLLLSLPLEEEKEEEEVHRVQDAWVEKGIQSRLVGYLLSADARTGMLTYADVC